MTSQQVNSPALLFYAATYSILNEWIKTSEYSMKKVAKRNNAGGKQWPFPEREGQA